MCFRLFSARSAVNGIIPTPLPSMQWNGAHATKQQFERVTAQNGPECIVHYDIHSFECQQRSSMTAWCEPIEFLNVRTSWCLRPQDGCRQAIP